MGIKLKTPKSEFKSALNLAIERQKAVVLRTFLYCAEEITNAARSTDSYQDQTGNLRSSIGTIVVMDGRIVREYGFVKVLNGAQGAAEGKEFAHSLVSKFPKGIVIIAVAGKEYASYVADKGYDVLDSAEELAKKLVPMYMKALKLL